MDLKKKDWPGEISQAIENMIISLLHSDFDRVFETISQVESFLDSL